MRTVSKTRIPTEFMKTLSPVKLKCLGFILIFFLSLAHNASAQEIQIKTEDSTLRLIFHAIEQQTNYGFTVSEDQINLDTYSVLKPGTYPLNSLFDLLAKIHLLNFEQVGMTWVVTVAANPTAPTLQIITGKVMDLQTRQPLEGATIILNEGKNHWAISNDKGSFKLRAPLGRQSLSISYIGYKPQHFPILMTSGREPYLEILLEQDAFQATEVKVIAGYEKDKPVNSLVYSSGRSFSLDEANRYAGSLGDPARMARNYAGIVPERDDRNDIVIRGNSPTGLLWRLDGIEIPNPNHYGGIGLTGNTITLLNINLLDNSDFLTGAFPSSYGNATAGVFDLHMRKPNPNDHQFWFQSGWNGLEIGAEGPIGKKEDPASFMAVYRYSFLDAMSVFGIDFGIKPQYQDFTTKVDIPVSEKLDLSFIGLASTSFINLDDRTQEETRTPATPFGYHYRVGSDLNLLGLNGHYRINNKSTLKGGFSVLQNEVDNKIDTFSLITDASEEIFREFSSETKYSLFADYNLRIGIRNTLRAGIRWDSYAINYHQQGLLDNGSFGDYMDANGWLNLLRIYAEDEYLLNQKWKARLGIHSQYLFFNESFAIEPRAAIQYTPNARHSLSLSYGMHNQMQPRTVYFVETQVGQNTLLTNENLNFTQSNHLVLAYDVSLWKDFRIKAESYYQALSQIPVMTNPNSTFSMANVGADFYIPNQDSLVNRGSGRNYGIELTLEKFLSKGYYFMFSSSIYQSEYKTPTSDWHNTAFNLNYILNGLGGYEHWFGQRFAMGCDIRATWAGGKPYTPIDESASLQQNEVVLLEDQAFSQRTDSYFRLDLRVYYRINYKKFYTEFALDLQNLTNRKNIYQREFVPETGAYNTFYHTGLFILPTFKLQF